MGKGNFTRKLKVKLKEKDRGRIRDLLAGGVQPVRVIRRAQVLDRLGQGQSSPQVAQALGWTAKGVRNIGWRYVQQGLERALSEAPRPGAARRLNERQEQQIIAMVCADPPEGRARWTVRLIAEEAVKRKLVPTVGRETIRILLRGHQMKPWREKKVVCGRTHSRIYRADGGGAGHVREAVEGRRTGGLHR